MQDSHNSATKTCLNCKKEINVSNFIMHENFCIKNMKPCEICKMIVNKNQKDEHFEAFHAKEKCECGELIEKQNLENHKSNQCPKRKANCQYCELTVDYSKLEEHENFCGTRTDLCDKCMRYITKVDMKLHNETDCQYPRKDQFKPQSRRHERENSFFEHEIKRINNEHENEAIFNNTENDLNTQRIHIDKPPRLDSLSDTMIPCEFCDEIVQVYDLHFHQVTCKQNPENFIKNDDLRANEDANNYLNSQMSNAQQPIQVTVPRIPTMKPNPSKTTAKQEVEMIPCEFCDYLFDLDSINAHQVNCNRQLDHLQIVRDIHQNVMNETVQLNDETNVRNEPRKRIVPTLRQNETERANHNLVNLQQKKSESKFSTNIIRRSNGINDVSNPSNHLLIRETPPNAGKFSSEEHKTVLCGNCRVKCRINQLEDHQRNCKEKKSTETSMNPIRKDEFNRNKDTNERNNYKIFQENEIGASRNIKLIRQREPEMAFDKFPKINGDHGADNSPKLPNRSAYRSTHDERKLSNKQQLPNGDARNA